MSERGILVGYDGSAASEDALAWAAREALARGTALTVCLAQVPRFPPSSGEQDSGDDPEGGARHLLERALRRAQDLMPGGDVRPLLADGQATAVLCKHCPTADMVVVGSRGGGGLPELPIGSVGLQVAAHAPGRVVVIRGHWRHLPGQPGPVVVGTEGSAASKAAVTFALEEASLRGTDLLAVCALADAPGAVGGAGAIRDDFDQLMSSLRERSAVTVRRHICDGSARHALLEAAAGAQMLVVGARGRGGLRGMPLGSVALAMVCYAPCPVGVVHAE